MKIETINVEGRELEVCDRNLSDSDYLVYEGKIYRWVAKSGGGVRYCITIHKPSTDETLHVKNQEVEKILWVLKPTGHMSI